LYKFTQYSGTQSDFIAAVNADWGLYAIPDADGATVYIFITDSPSPHIPFTVMYVTPTIWFGQGLNGDWEAHLDTEMQGYNCAYTSAPPPE
jgi:hypothetical protein